MFHILQKKCLDFWPAEIGGEDGNDVWGLGKAWREKSVGWSSHLTTFTWMGESLFSFFCGILIKMFCVVRHLRMPPSCCCRSRWRSCRDGWRRWCQSPSAGRRQTSSSRFAEKRLLHQIVCFQLIFSAPMHSSHECPVGKNLNFCTGSNLL